MPERDPAPVAPIDTANLAVQLIALIEGLGQMVEAVAGYRKKCEEAGFSPTAAEAMAVEMHRHLLATAFRASK